MYRQRNNTGQRDAKTQLSSRLTLEHLNAAGPKHRPSAESGRNCLVFMCTPIPHPVSLDLISKFPFFLPALVRQSSVVVRRGQKQRQRPRQKHLGQKSPRPNYNPHALSMNTPNAASYYMYKSFSNCKMLYCTKQSSVSGGGGTICTYIYIYTHVFLGLGGSYS